MTITVYVLAAGLLRDRAEATVTKAQAAGQLPAGSVSAIPQPPWIGRWAVFIEGEDAIWAGSLDLITQRRPRVVRYSYPERDRYLLTAISTPEAVRFLRFARYPCLSRVDGPDGTVFELEDLRFSMSGWEQSNRWFGICVEVGRDGTVRYAGFSNP